MTRPFEITSNKPVNPAVSPARPYVPGGRSDFAEKLTQAQQSSGVQDLKFSNHAQKRMQTRDISLTDDGLARLANAVEKAEKRGGRESLVLMDELAFIVNVPNRLVVTAIDADSRGEGVFTQIDSVVIADGKPEA